MDGSSSESLLLAWAVDVERRRDGSGGGGTFLWLLLPLRVLLHEVSCGIAGTSVGTRDEKDSGNILSNNSPTSVEGSICSMGMEEGRSRGDPRQVSGEDSVVALILRDVSTLR